MSPIRPRNAAKAAAWMAAGAIGATALTGIAFAASNGRTDTAAPGLGAAPAATAPATPPAGGPDGMRRGPGGRFGLGGPGGPVLHGDLTVKDRTGTITTVRVQTGDVVTATDTTLSVKSEDGYTSDWTINAATKIRRDGKDVKATDLKAGDKVLVRGPLSGSTATAAVVRALSPAEAARLKTQGDTMRQRMQQRMGSGSSGTGTGTGTTSGPDPASAPDPLDGIV